MPRMFREVLNLVISGKNSKDEFQQSWHDKAIQRSYRIIVVLAYVMFFISILATGWGLTNEELRHLIETFSMLLIAYAFIVPFGQLAWSIKPLNYE